MKGLIYKILGRVFLFVSSFAIIYITFEKEETENHTIITQMKLIFTDNKLRKKDIFIDLKIKIFTACAATTESILETPVLQSEMLLLNIKETIKFYLIKERNLILKNIYYIFINVFSITLN